MQLFSGHWIGYDRKLNVEKEKNLIQATCYSITVGYLFF